MADELFDNVEISDSAIVYKISLSSQGFCYIFQHTNYGMRTLLLILIVTTFTYCSKSAFKSKWTKHTAPEYFKAKFETTKGSFVIESYRKWSPKAVDRLYQLIKSGYYNNAIIYRIVPNYVVQWGRVDTPINRQWEQFKVPDEPVTLSNEKGVMGFARSGKESRNHQLFINLKDNLRLDTLTVGGVTGYPGVAKVIEGMEMVPTFFEYEAKTIINKIYTSKNALELIEKEFPKVDKITKAYLLK
jgi:cyclophilin family peptidyl-prolyl cis-trans isomerase